MTSAALPLNPGAPKMRIAEIAVALVVVMILALIIVPLPPVLLDLFLAASIGSSLVVLLVALYTTNPLDFSSFPALLLLLTLFRIGLNVSSTRLILTQAHAGKVIEAFGQFVIGGNYAVGIVIFLILIGINFIVITKGAGRIAEVAARFTLDAMPGKQMAIDADLSAGLIDEKEARTRRDEISRTADFYGAMDGASKYVKGDAILGILVVIVNIVGGIFIGVIQRGMDVGKAASTYTILTVGDGLVSQVPALIISTAAGIMVTAATSTDRIGTVLSRQLGGHPRAMWMVAGVLGAFSLIPALPMFPFLAMAAGTAVLAKLSTQAEAQRTAEALMLSPTVSDAPEVSATPDPMQDLLQIDPIELEVGYALIPLVDEGQGGDLLERISLLRKQAALELGILVPPIRIRDDIRLPANEYVIKLRGSEVARAEVLPRFMMALNTGAVVAEIDGMDTIDPSFGMPARWVAASRRAEAEALGYVVVEPTTVVATHLLETLKGSAAELLGRQEVQEMVETLKKSHPALVEEIIPGKVSLSVLHRVLQRLLRERVPIRDLVTILEAIGDGAEATKDPEVLTEVVRKALTNVIARLFADPTGTIRGITIGARLESALLGLFSPRTAQATTPMLTPESLAGMLRDLNHLATTYAVDGRPLPLITPPSLRVGVRRLIEPVLPSLPVVSLAELPAQITLSSVATWEMPNG
ncbi:flagellar biosynthesis protein FlhA [Gemmatimonas sp.]|jgi:flagellar biosynthesis protein FlhA|uniref:flagellar biosynthesis protein FlhA n=1 Tax=Gemmatimonas sp. TaxID=1962908 RepID=UPI0022C068AE|nr:flagellar biosynthesis protein FlhA [Gemmatimonas sp.]MCZ8203861.1 flagellar biosynthesis protein FlhA [Gemmatimonas sp.]